MNRFVVMEEGTGASKLELFCYQVLHIFTLRKSVFLASLITIINDDLEKIKTRKVF